MLNGGTPKGLTHDFEEAMRTDGMILPPPFGRYSVCDFDKFFKGFQDYVKMVFGFPPDEIVTDYIYDNYSLICLLWRSGYGPENAFSFINGQAALGTVPND